MDKNTRPPFFLAYGAILPHPPMVAPARFMKMYNLEDLPEPVRLRPPKNAPEESLHRSSNGENLA